MHHIKCKCTIAIILTILLKDIGIHSHFFLQFPIKRYISIIHMKPIAENFANGAVWYTIVFKVSEFYFVYIKTGDRNCRFRLCMWFIYCK